MANMKPLVCLLLSLFAAATLLAQPANDDCVGALDLDAQINALEWCSDPAAFSSDGATTSLPQADYPVCLTDQADIEDVWFSFTAQATDISITVSGDVAPVPLGDLQTPQFAIYSGSCGDLQPVACRSPAIGTDFTTGIFTDLEPGQTYFINVSGRLGRDGSFQICLNQFFAVPEPSGDCSTGVILCDKSSFAVPFLSGNGLIQDPLGDILCMEENCGSIGSFGESNSAWYKWTCDDPGTLTFTIDPLSGNAREDIDFLLYELPNGLDDCSEKINLRCMLSGETNGNTLEQNLPCLGDTGLSDFDMDDREECGCQLGNNNFLEAIEMEAGKVYGLLIMNFSATGDGFAISFGGTGTFVGPEANFTTNLGQACVGETVTFTDNSFSPDPIVNYNWDFGSTAEPSTLTGPGPHSVRFIRPGTVSVVLEVESSRGCLVTTIQSGLEVTCCPDHFDVDAQISSLDCPNDMTGAIDLTASSGFAPITYAWNTNSTDEDLNGLGLGTYTVTITDEATCQTQQTFNVTGPPAFSFDTSIVMPTCDGGIDGALTFGVDGGTPGYEWSFNNAPFSTNNTIGNLPIGEVNVRIRDANGCTVEQDIFVNELVLTLDPALVSVIEPICMGDTNGQITLGVNNGLGPYSYDFGAGFQPNPIFPNIPAGTYQVEVRDANNCRGQFEFEVPDPPLLEASLMVDDVSCFGAGDGMVTSMINGGRPSYSLQWSNNTNGAGIDQLGPGIYTLTVIDDNGCELEVSAEVIEPGEIFGSILEVIDNLCFGEAGGSALMDVMGGTSPFTFSSDGTNFQSDPLLANLAAGDYQLIVQDAEGCTDTVSATISQPEEFLLNVVDLVAINLGFDTTITVQSNYNPVTYNWSPDIDLECLTANCNRVLVSPPNGTTYIVEGTNEAGCLATASVRVVVVKDRPVYIPNVFSPDGNGLNDGFTLFAGPAVAQIERLQIFDRWGGMVYNGEGPFMPNEPSLGWDGRFNGSPVNSGVFVYKIDVRFLDGEVITYAGDVTVVR